jgi:hypothetical protein
VIYLNNNKIGDQGAKKLSEAFELNNINHLGLDGNYISNHTFGRIKAALTDPKRKMPSNNTAAASQLSTSAVPVLKPLTVQAQQTQIRQQSSQSSSRSSSNSNGGNAGLYDSGDSRGLTDQEKKEKERFLMFTRVLMK